MNHTIAISNHKGGVGKTTSTVNIGFGLHASGKKVLLIDLDPQSNLSQSIGVTNAPFTIYGALKKQYPATPIKVVQGLDVIPSTIDLSGAEIELSAEIGREFILRDILEPLKKTYDYILIDCPPSLGLLTINAFTSSTEVLIPLQAEYLALQGMSKLLEVIEKIQKHLNKEMKMGGVFITQFDNRKVLNRNIAETIEEHFGENVFKTRIRENIALAEAPSQHNHIYDYEPESKGAEDYINLCKELLNKHNNTNNIKNTKK